MRRSTFSGPPDTRLPGVAAADPAVGARAVDRLLPDAIARAEALGLAEVVRLLEDSRRLLARRAAAPDADP